MKKRKAGAKHKGWKGAASPSLAKGNPAFVAVIGLGPKLSKKVRATYAGKTIPHS